jgi:hypothetical protein
MSLSPEEIDNLVEELMSVDPAGGYPDGYDGRVLDAIGAIIASDGDAYTDNECLGMIHQLVNHWSEVVDL